MRGLISSQQLGIGPWRGIVTEMITEIGKGRSYSEANFDTILRIIVQYYPAIPFIGLFHPPSSSDTTEIQAFAKGCLRYMASSRFDPFASTPQDDSDQLFELYAVLVEQGYSIGPLNEDFVDCFRYKLIPFFKAQVFIVSI